MNLIGTLVSWSLILHGTKDYPIQLKQSDSNTQPEVTETPVFTGTTLPPVSQKSAYWENFSRFHLKEIVIKLKEGNWNTHFLSKYLGNTKAIVSNMNFTWNKNCNNVLTLCEIHVLNEIFLMPFSCDFYKRHKWLSIWSTFTVHVVFRNVTMSV